MISEIVHIAAAKIIPLGYFIKCIYLIFITSLTICSLSPATPTPSFTISFDTLTDNLATSWRASIQAFFELCSLWLSASIFCYLKLVFDWYEKASKSFCLVHLIKRNDFLLFLHSVHKLSPPTKYLQLILWIILNASRISLLWPWDESANAALIVTADGNGSGKSTRVPITS